GDAGPRSAFVGARPDLAARRTEVDADRIVRIDRHRLPLHREPPAFGQTGAEPRPRLARVTRDVRGGLPVGARAGPNVGAVHREDPRGVGIARVELDREADVADRARHVVADAKPPGFGPLRAVDAAVVLLVRA